MIRRLDLASLGGLPADVQRPAYPVAETAIGVVHLGVGNFFRAHQAVYLDAAMNAGEAGWGICGVSLRSPATRDALAPQQGLYSVIEREGDSVRARVIGSLRELLVAPEDPGRVVDRLAGAGVRWVTLTITEKGYEPEPPGTGDPRTAVGLLLAALRRRREIGLPGLALLSCDNLSGNGDRLRQLLRECDRDVPGARLGGWLDDHVDFPNTMVDRIVPRTRDDDRRTACERLGVEDAWPVPVEPFSQWVIEDRLRVARPDLARFGVSWVDDVAPYELMKLRLLNAAHSALAYLAVPACLATVDRAIAEPTLRRAVTGLWNEVVPGLPAAQQAIARPYTDSLLRRFENPGLMHRTLQIAMDGSQKVPLRLLPSIRDNLRAGRPIRFLSWAVAAWIHYLGGVDRAGGVYHPDDPLADSLRARLASASDTPGRVRALLGDARVFGDLVGDTRLLGAVGAALGRIETHGTMADPP